MQALTVAISSSGLQYLAHELIVGKFVSALSGLAPPDNRVWGPARGAIRNFVLTLSGGSMSDFTPRFSSFTQGAGGQFTLMLTADGCTVNYTWHEEYDYQQWYGHAFGPWEHKSQTWPYTTKIDNFTITVPITFTQQTQSYSLVIGTVVATPSGLHQNFPSDSVVQPGGCYESTVTQITVSALSRLDLQTPIQNLFQNLLGTIPASGKLTPNIVFNFNEGDTALAFPSNAGLSLGVTGNVTWQGSAYSGGSPPTLTVPTMPATNHVHFLVADYEFNELYWAWFKDGRLNSTITAAQLPDPPMLNTNYYSDGALAPLHRKYPNHQMTVGVTPTCPPTVTFRSAYELVYGHNGVLTTQEATLPAGVYQALGALQGSVYLSQDAYTTALQNALGPTGAQYIPQIEQASMVNGPNGAFTQAYQVTQNDLTALQASLPPGVYKNLAAGLTVGQAFVDKSWLLVAVQNALASIDQTNQYGSQIAAAFAVSGTFNQVYWVTPGTNGGLTTLVDQLPPDVYNDVVGLEHTVYLDQTSFVAALQTAIGNDAGKYEAPILQAAGVNGAIVTQALHATVNVLQAGQPVECFVIAVKEVDFQQNFHLGAVGTSQTVQSDLQIIHGETTASLVSTKIPGIDGSTFKSIWDYVLQPVYALETQKMAHAGVPLPFMQGFEFVFNQATVAIQPGYADVLADMKYVGSQSYTDALMQDPGTADLAAFVVQDGVSNQPGANGRDGLRATRDPEPVALGAANGVPTLSRTPAAASRTRLVRRDES